MLNGSRVTEFQLLGFSDVPALWLVQLVMLLTVYLTALTGNILIVCVISFDHRLHNPMYFFLMNLSIVDMGTISVTIPKSMSNTRSISYFGCAAQVFFLVFFIAMDVSFLTIMAYDRYLAICDPLHYPTVMSRRACTKMAVSAWTYGLLYSAVHAGGTFANTFCSNVINQFFCEIPQLLKLSCSSLYLIEVGLILFSGCLIFTCFVFIMISYMHIFKAVMKIPSAKGRQKALSTCLPHLIVFSLFISTTFFAYLRPISRSPSELDLVVAMIYSVVPPVMNPVIYSIRNKDIQAALWKLTGRAVLKSG